MSDSQLQAMNAIAGMFAVGFFVSLFFLPAFFYLLTLSRALANIDPSRRPISPRGVWWGALPVFGIVWMLFVSVATAGAMRDEFKAAGRLDHENGGRRLAIWMTACACCSWVPVLGFVTLPAGLILWGVFWNKIARLNQKLPLSATPAFLVPMPASIKP